MGFYIRRESGSESYASSNHQPIPLAVDKSHPHTYVSKHVEHGLNTVLHLPQQVHAARTLIAGAKVPVAQGWPMCQQHVCVTGNLAPPSQTYNAHKQRPKMLVTMYTRPSVTQVEINNTVGECGAMDTHKGHRAAS